MGQMMSELAGGSPEDFDGDMKSPLYVLTNSQKWNGAAAMFWPEKIGEIADKIGDDLYVLPSSIHEVLCLPVEDADAKALADIVVSLVTVWTARGEE